MEIDIQRWRGLGIVFASVAVVTAVACTSDFPDEIVNDIPGPEGPDAGESCQDLAEGDDLSHWHAGVSATSATKVEPLGPREHAVRGKDAIRLVTDSARETWARYEAPEPINASARGELRLAVRGTTANISGWEFPGPVIVVEDADGARRTYTPTYNLLGKYGTEWASIRIPFEGNALWKPSGGEVDWARIHAIEVRADSMGPGFTLDIDGVGLQSSAVSCPLACPEDCNGHGTCSPETGTCACALGYAPPTCAQCGEGFQANSAGKCVLAREGKASKWPNAFSRSNSDPWLAVHHDEIELLTPNVLVLMYANPGTVDGMQALVNDIIDGFREASRVQGYKDGNAPYQLDYKPIFVDLRDGVNDRPPPPEGYPYENSTLYPRRDKNATGYWRFDYAKLFTQEYAQHLGFPDPELPGKYLDLCELVARGDVHEVWIVGSADVKEDVDAAEVLGSGPVYDITGNKTGAMTRCSGNGCGDADFPICGRTIRIGFVNYRRGAGCYWHSQGHMVEQLSWERIVPGLAEWFTPFANFNLDTRYGLPVDRLYLVQCSDPFELPDGTKSCTRILSPTEREIRHRAAGSLNDTLYHLQDYDPVCGSVHFPPNAMNGYEYHRPNEVRSSCAGFGRHGRPNGEDVAELLNEAAWSGIPRSDDCGGRFLIWWYQNMPGFGSNQTFSDGRRMKSVWPYLFY